MLPRQSSTGARSALIVCALALVVVTGSVILTRDPPFVALFISFACALSGVMVAIRGMSARAESTAWRSQRRRVFLFTTIACALASLAAAVWVAVASAVCALLLLVTELDELRSLVHVDRSWSRVDGPTPNAFVLDLGIGEDWWQLTDATYRVHASEIVWGDEKRARSTVRSSVAIAAVVTVLALACCAVRVLST